MNSMQELGRKLMPLMPWWFRLKWWAWPVLQYVCPLLRHKLGGWRIGDTDGVHCCYCNRMPKVWQ